MATPLRRGLKSLLEKSPHDIVILSALRTPITRSYKGGLKDAHDHEMLYHVLRATLTRFPNLDRKMVQDICVGTVLSELGGSKAGRMAALHAGFADTTALSTVNRACASSLTALTSIAQAIATGSIDIGLSAGMESMTRNYASRAIPTSLWPALRDSHDQNARDCLMAMGLTAENVAERYGIGRGEQDAFAVESQAKAVRAQREGAFGEEIVEVEVEWTDPKSKADDAAGGEGGGATPKRITVSKDDGIRATSLEKLQGMKPAFKEGGTATAGNSSQISDGAGAVLMMSRSEAERLGLQKEIQGKWVGTQTVGCRPDEMGVGPALAVPKLLDFVGVKREEVGIWEINEAFASQVLYCVRELGIPMERVNPKGGAIALGHPLGATGVRMVAGLLPELRRRDERVGVVSMCVGTGMGSAALFVRE